MREFIIIFYLVLIFNIWVLCQRINQKCDHIIKNQVVDYNEFKEYIKRIP